MFNFPFHFYPFLHLLLPISPHVSMYPSSLSFLLSLIPPPFSRSPPLPPFPYHPFNFHSSLLPPFPLLPFTNPFSPTSFSPTAPYQSPFPHLLPFLTPTSPHQTSGHPGLHQQRAADPPHAQGVSGRPEPPLSLRWKLREDSPRAQPARRSARGPARRAAAGVPVKANDRKRRMLDNERKRRVMERRRTFVVF